MALSIQTTGFSDAMVILGAAGVVIPAFARARISPVIGFILVGVIVGPAGLGRLVNDAPWLFYVTISDSHAIEPFAELGIVFLLFSIGLELSFARLWAMRRAVFGLGSAELVGCALLMGAGLLMLGASVPAAVGIGAALALSSTALVLPIAGTTGPVGERAFAMLLFEDLALVPIIFALGALAPQSADAGWAPVLHTMLIGGITVTALFVGGRIALPRLFAQAARTKSPELFLAVSLLVVILASVATSAAGLSPIVGALLAGILIAETDYHQEVELMTQPFQGLALGVFLLTVGMSLDLSIVARDWQKLLLGVAGVVAVKALVTGALLRVGGSRWSVAFETGLMMAAPGETTLIVLTAAIAARLISPADAAFWQAVTAIGLTVTPLLAALGSRIGRRMEEEPLTATAVPEPQEGRVLIIGFGRVGRLVAQMLDDHRLPYLGLDADADTVTAARARGYSATFGDIARPGMIEHLDAGAARAVVLTMDDPVQAMRITRQLRASYPQLSILARARDPNHAAQLYRAGVTEAVPETLESSLQLSEAVLVDLGLAMGPVIASIHEKRAQLRGKIRDMGAMDREPLGYRRRLAEES